MGFTDSYSASLQAGSTTIIPQSKDHKSHIYWDANGIHDLSGLFQWGMTGAVPVSGSSATPGYPARSGPFSDANYYVGASANDPLDTTGDRYGTVVFIPGTIPAGSISMFCNGAGNTNGYYFGINAGTGVFSFRCYNGSAFAAQSANAVVPREVNVASFWRIGTNINVMLNLGAVATTGSAAEATGIVYYPFVGRYNAINSAYTEGTLIEIAQGTGTVSGVDWATKIQQDVFTRAGKANAWIRS